jgi:16S rRNA (uracil1498-N3)-methyltransferase
MALSRIFSESPVTAGATVQLSGGVARHVTRVLRLGAGDDIILFDGSGCEFEGQVISVSSAGVDHNAGISACSKPRVAQNHNALARNLS